MSRFDIWIVRLSSAVWFAWAAVYFYLMVVSTRSLAEHPGAAIFPIVCAGGGLLVARQESRLLKFSAQLFFGIFPVLIVMGPLNPFAAADLPHWIGDREIDAWIACWLVHAVVLVCLGWQLDKVRLRLIATRGVSVNPLVSSGTHGT